jgi:hypothetical protein
MALINKQFAKMAVLTLDEIALLMVALKGLSTPREGELQESIDRLADRLRAILAGNITEPAERMDPFFQGVTGGGIRAC